MTYLRPTVEENPQFMQPNISKLGITTLNPMQKEALATIAQEHEVILLSPTGTGKTLAFLLPIFEKIDATKLGVQVLIIVPSRELAIQIEQVARDLGSGQKINAVYGGRNVSKDVEELNTLPSILIGTPGRVCDHMDRQTFDVDTVHTLVLDEYDKSLEIGFEEQMEEIVSALANLKCKVLTSATEKESIPEFVGLQSPKVLHYLSGGSSQLQVKIVKSEDKDKLSTLTKLLSSLSDKNGIVFCNYKDTIGFVGEYLDTQGISHGRFYGGLEQRDRERALIKFRNGTDRVLLATDLAARGIDIPEMDYIIHYQVPLKEQEFVHRNGRTARMHSDGVAYVLQWVGETPREFIHGEEAVIGPSAKDKVRRWSTLFVSGGRKDKISKGDIAGLFFKQGGLDKDELGLIELKQDCVFVAVPYVKAKSLVGKLSDTRLKKKKVRISII